MKIVILVFEIILVFETEWSYKKKRECLFHIGCMCLVSFIYNHSLQLQMLDLFIVIFWLCNIL